MGGGGGMWGVGCVSMGGQNERYARGGAAAGADVGEREPIFMVFHVCAVCFAGVWEYVRPCMCAPGGA